MNNNLGNKATMAKNIKYYMKQQGKTRNDVCEAINVAYTTLADWVNAVTYPRIDKIQMMANYFGISKADLVEEHDSWGNASYEPSIPFPIIGDIAAGFGHEAIEEETGDYEQIPVSWLHGRPKEDFFVLRVKGSSMYPAYQEGDRVLVRRKSSVESGTVAVVLYDATEATLKKVKYKPGEDWMDLIPLNPEYAPRRVENHALEQCRILGEAIRLIRVIK